MRIGLPVIVRLLFAGLTALSVLSCAPRLSLDVKAYYDPDKDLRALKRFSLIALNRDNPLLEKELLYLVKVRLAKRGYVYDEAAPDFRVKLQWHVAQQVYYYPPEVRYRPEYLPGETRTRSGTVGGKDYRETETSSGRYELVPYLTSGVSDKEYVRLLSITAVSPDKSMPSREGDVIWTGQVESAGPESDIRVVAGFLTDELLGEFPVRSGKPGRRQLDVRE